ncbi:MAG: CoB--CoM heterodisulfide reductase iron-sulfur subunit B family protein [Oligoflexia bacterium]|nr:CoB--CoM heterodisulfide reductase iron-sulfur subunit B family protein [Oligoflexia bacterium]
MKSYHYFPGCSLEGMAKEFDQTTREIFTTLGASLKEIEDWSCCGATSAHFTDRLLSYALPARNLNITKKCGGNELAVSCAACFARLKVTSYNLQKDAKLRGEVAEVMEVEEKELNSLSDVVPRHILEILTKDFSVEDIKSKVIRDLSGLKIAPYYGCLLVRPPQILEFDDPENPMIMDNIIKTVGASVVDFPFKTECCGASLTLSKADIVANLTKKIITEARDAGADLIVVACPLCQTNLDMRQLDLQSDNLIDFEIPVIYFTQLMGLAFGIDEKKLGFNRNMIAVLPTIKEKLAAAVVTKVATVATAATSTEREGE